MENPFEELTKKLELIEDLILDLKKEILIKPKEQSQPKLIKIEDAARLTGYKKGYIYEMVCRKISHNPDIIKLSSFKHKTAFLTILRNQTIPFIFPQPFY